MPESARPQRPATAAANASVENLCLSAAGTLAIAGLPCTARNSGLRARSDGDRQASSHASRTARVTSVSSVGDPVMVAATLVRLAVTSNLCTGAKAGWPDSTPASNASVPRPYALATAAPVRTATPVPLRAGSGGATAGRSAMRSPDLQNLQHVDHAGDRRHPGDRVVVDVKRPVTLLELVHQPGQFQGVDRFRDLLRLRVTRAGEHRDDVRPLRYSGEGQCADAGWLRGATARQNSPTVMPASVSPSSSSNFTPKWSSTRTTSSARASDSRSAPAGPSTVSSSMSSMRSEEHTSELQSRQYLVCRLL